MIIDIELFLINRNDLCPNRSNARIFHVFKSFWICGHSLRQWNKNICCLAPLDELGIVFVETLDCRHAGHESYKQ